MNLSNENVIHINKNGVQYLQFKKLLEYSDIINHAYSLGLDVNFRTATVDKKPLPIEKYNDAIKNYKNLCETLEMNFINIIKCRQNHTKNIGIISKKINKDAPDFDIELFKEGVDGLVTNKPNLILGTTNADCILLLFFDPIKKVISNVHSGWKGTLQEISIQAVNKMINEYNCSPSNIICCICPSIRKCHFEVDKDVKDMFFNKFKNLEEINQIIEYNAMRDKWNIDTVLINRVILKKLGLKDENIIDSGICSVCNSNLVHSFRVEKEGYGLETALIELKDYQNKEYINETFRTKDFIG
ncbi:MAG: polyphenol oxidase family protein [Clostridia bacterium]|nr:polyphenol oxidase family protein [Clostridia bacterium]